jgi:hypothetical protein
LAACGGEEGGAVKDGEGCTCVGASGRERPLPSASGVHHLTDLSPFSLVNQHRRRQPTPRPTRLVDEIVWVKTTVNRRLFKSHGYYLQHAKEVCLVGRRGAGPPAGVASQGGGGPRGAADVIVSERRGQSQKPEEIYDVIESLVPGGERAGADLMCVFWGLRGRTHGWVWTSWNGG